MKYPVYTGTNPIRPDNPVDIPTAQRATFSEAEQYFPDPGLVDAANVALLLGQPLLLTGEPGTGKTQFAFSLAWELGFAEPEKFETKSNSTAKDLFYIYDSLRRFQDAQEGKQEYAALDYLSYNALGLAILRASRKEDVQDFLPPGLIHEQTQRTVVLIDEVDKAPRDFPNDILNELESMYFRIPEMGNVKIEAQPDMQPIVIISSNSEKDLPDAFLRRCVYYHIPFPEDEQLRRIISARLGLSGDGGDTFLGDALSLFRLLRSRQAGLRKRPATAELLGWLRVMREISSATNPLATPGLAIKTIGSLIKTADDLGRARELVADWMARRAATQRAADGDNTSKEQGAAE